MKQTTPILIDIDGVLRLGGKPAPGLYEFFNFLNEKNLNACLVSNTTLTTSEEQKKFFEEQKIELNFPILTASDATYQYVKKNYKRAAVYCIDKVKKIFEDVIDMDNPDVVVIGDMEKDWNYEILTEIFRKVRTGADLIAMQKNRYWNTPEDGYLLDVGPFVAAIEYATEKEATIIGKPSKIYFDSALNLIDSSIEEPFIMIGDDIETDIGAAQKYGGTGILVYTGKTQYPLPKESKIKPDYEAMNLREVVDLINNIKF
ncbi:MAG: HAD-IIA family hydrolase [Melioribacteraceae bacterium]|nr:HAD-IIA family hydrolase [Melioribacteraceae bacterium]